MTQFNLRDSLIVGVDVHKYGHVASLVDPFMQIINTFNLRNTEEDMNHFLNTVFESNVENKPILFALEDVNGYGFKLSRFLLSQNQIVISVCSNLTERERKRTVQGDKTDALDSIRVARQVVLEGGRLPRFLVTKENEISSRIRSLVDDRENLVVKQGSIKNHLHELLHRLFENYHGIVPFKDIFCGKVLVCWQELLTGDEYRQNPVAQRCLFKIKQFSLMIEEIKLLEMELEEVALESNQTQALMNNLYGCKLVTATRLMAEIKDVNRFKNPAALAKFCGIAPREHSSGSQLRHNTNYRGNRKLNHYLHQLAVTHIAFNAPQDSKTYFQKKVKEGKSKMHALRCLKRHLVSRIWRMLRDSIEEPNQIQLSAENKDLNR